MHDIPAHVAIIMDGNGRWAAERGLERIEGHAAGEAALLDVIEGALDIGIQYLSLFSFSTENWQRPKQEVDFLMSLLKERVTNKRLQEVDEKGGRVRVIGRRGNPVPADILELIVESENKTRENKQILVVYAFNYGGRAEIADAAKAIAQAAINGDVKPAEIDEDLVAQYLYAPDLPEIDLLIRTSGEMRISNFMLWQLAYSEIVFTDLFWPDFRREDLAAAVKEYQSRDRRFGGL